MIGIKRGPISLRLPYLHGWGSREIPIPPILSIPNTQPCFNNLSWIQDFYQYTFDSRLRSPRGPQPWTPVLERPFTFLVLSLSHHCLLMKPSFYRAAKASLHNPPLLTLVEAWLPFENIASPVTLPRVAGFFSSHTRLKAIGALLTPHCCFQIIYPLSSPNLSFKYNLWACITHYPTVVVICSPGAFCPPLLDNFSSWLKITLTLFLS